MSGGDIAMLVIAGLLVVAAGLLVGAETAIGRVSRTRVDEMCREHVSGAERLAIIVNDRPQIGRAHV